MADAQAALFYGVYVETAYLCFASDAHKETKDTLLAIDLICARRRKEILTTISGSSGLKEIPGEVWDMIKVHIIDEEMDEAEENEIEGFFHLLDSENEADGSDDEPEEGYDWSRIDSNKRFWTSFVDRSDGMFGMFEDRLKEIKQLLKAHGLALPFDELYYPNEEVPDSYMHVLSPIGLPFPSTNASAKSDSFRQNSVHADSDYNTNHKTLTFSKKSLDLPSDADQRIKRFLKLFRLDSKDPDVPIVDRPPPKSKSKRRSLPQATKPEEESESKEVDHENGCCVNPKLDPHWRLWTSAYSNW